MPHAWALVDNSFPTFTEGDSPQEQITALIDYMMILTEALKYQLENLDTNNWNTTALDNFQIDTTKDVSEQLASIAKQLNVVTNEVAAVKIRLSTAESRAAQIETDVSYLENEQKKTDQNVEALQEAMGDVQSDIGGLQEEMGEAQADIGQLQEQMGNAQADIDELQQQTDALQEMISTDESGNVTLGKEGKSVYLTGKIYVNGVLIE